MQPRKTFAIISHPDAGKTTLTEKLLLYGGAIRLAGTVKGRKAQKHAVSDWMEIEKQRGISVTSSVLQFDYDGFRINILDTPGHQDFSEDTYRTLMAADSAVMLIDAAKGVEEQTKKLFKVCKQRQIPVFTFVNKLDRYAKNPFELMEEIEQTLGIRTYPMNWPIGTDGAYKGIYIRDKAQIELFDDCAVHGQQKLPSTIGSVKDPMFKDALGEEIFNSLCEDIDLLDVAGEEFSKERIDNGDLSPLFFGSALTNFGVRLFLEEFLKLAPPPAPRISDNGSIDPKDENFSAFVFKIQANMNPAHRDRLAFMRICSGKFTKGMSVYNPQLGKSLKLAQPQQFLAQERAIIEEAYPGDVIGLFDPGILRIGDTLCEEGKSFRFSDFPVFPPEQFAKVQAKDTMKRKQFLKGMNELAQEGAVQIFKQYDDFIESFIVGAVGTLQFEVLEYRLKNEYGVDILINHLTYTVARWVTCEESELKALKNSDNILLIKDHFDQPVVLANNEWQLKWVMERNKEIEFTPVPKDAQAI